MVAQVPTNPLILFNLKLDDGEVNLARKTINFKTVPFQARVIKYGTVDRSIAYPPGSLHSNDCTIELEDVDNVVRAWFDALTPLRRLGEIIFEFEYNTNVIGMRDFPVTPGSGLGRTEPISDPLMKPLYTGEVIDVQFPPRKAVITLRDITTKWLERQIPKLITRDVFPNLPDDLESAFAPIILGRLQSVALANVGKQGVILCPYVDTVLHRYCVARHTCYSVLAVYRKKRLDRFFKLVSPSEYSVANGVGYSINGIIYDFCFIDFTAQQEDGTVIHADVSGYNKRIDLGTEVVTVGEQRNPADAFINLLYFLLQDEIRIDSYDAESFSNLRNKFTSLGWLCDGAITENLNVGLDSGVTTGQAIGRLCSDFQTDIFMSNQGKITAKFYDPHATVVERGDWDDSTNYSVNDVVYYLGNRYIAITSGHTHQPDISPLWWQLVLPGDLDVDSKIPVDVNLTLRQTVTPSISTKIYNRIRYRYHHQNAGLTEYVTSAKSSQWTWEDTVDNTSDQSEMLNTGQNPLLEDVVEMYFVRDDTTAVSVIKRRLGFHTLRSYPVKFKLPGPEVVRYLQLASSVSFTHYEGVKALPGWVAEPFKITRIAFDLSNYECEAEAVRYVKIPEGSLLSSFLTYGHSASASQIRIPPYPVLVNGSLDGGILVQDAEPQTNFNDDNPAPPDTLEELVDVNLIYTFTAGVPSTETIDPAQSGYVNVRFQEDQTTTPRLVSGYVPIPNFRHNIRYYAGTLSPDQKPTGLVSGDAYKVIFYATDFDHEYIWTGTVWRQVDGVIPGTVTFHTFNPGLGYHVCDGSTNVTSSTTNGTTGLVDIPLLNSSTFIMGNSSYTGPTPSVAAAPTLASMSTAGAHVHAGTTVGGHTHSLAWSGSTSSDGAHVHVADVTVTDLGHSHSFSFSGASGTLSGTAASDGAHDHGGYTDNGSNDGAHIHTGAAGPTEMDGIDIDVASHHHPLGSGGGSTATGASSASSTDGYDLSHNHTLTGVTGTITSSSSEGDFAAEDPTSAADTGDTVTVSGGTDSALGSHSHGMSHTHSYGTGAQTGDADGSAHIDQNAINVDIPNTDSAHKHIIASGGAHTHSVTGTAGSISGSGSTGSSNASISVGVTVESGGAHTHTYSSSGTSGSTSPSISISSDGGHTHTLTMNTDGLPKRMGLLPYIRL